jgi:arylsulfatase A-like enzyme
MEENTGEKPFLLTISTIDMHPPYEALYKAPGSHGIKMLDCLYSTDRAIGLFWDYFRKSRYRDNTMIVVMADHAMGGGNAYDSFLGKYHKTASPFCDYITCFFHLPKNPSYRGQKNDILCTNLDLLPSIIAMINIDCENPFTGLSVFSERPKYPVPLSVFRMQDYPILMEGVTPEIREGMRKLDWTAANQDEFMEYMYSLAVTRSIYPPLKQ